VTVGLRERFGPVEEAECAAWGARTDDLLMEPHQQILNCFPGVEPRRTLVVMTVGGNDMSAIAKAAMDGDSDQETEAKVTSAIALLEEAVHYLVDDPARFPSGVFVIFSNIYEYTDGVGDLLSCPTAILAGLGGSWPQGRPHYLRVNEQFVRIARQTNTDVLFLLENFCGHGFHAGDPNNECYRGPDARTWFDLTCIHPNPEGHAAIADMLLAVVDE
jgi:lysophospholipase L1-like esterase